jgi:hypothetical protein
MRNYLFPSIFLLLFLGCLNTTDAQVVVKYDPVNPPVIPFDQPFVIQLADTSGSKIKIVYVYEVGYDRKTHTTILIDRKYKTATLPSFRLEDPNQFLLNGTTRSIVMPAMKPDHDFDIYFVRQFSKTDLALALKINKALHKNKTKSDADIQADPRSARIIPPYTIRLMQVLLMRNLVGMSSRMTSPDTENQSMARWSPIMIR